MVNLIIEAVYYSFVVIQGILFARILLSWFRIDALSGLNRLLHQLTEPILVPIRYMVDKSIFGSRVGGITIDISPLIAFIFLQLLQSFFLVMMAK